MGRRKGSKNKKRKGSEKVRETNSTFLSEFVGGLVFVLGLALIVVFRFDNIGVAADAINTFFTGIFGVARYAISVICMYVGIVSILSSKKQKIGTELLKGFKNAASFTKQFDNEAFVQGSEYMQNTF